MAYERFALICDTEASELGSVAVRLLELGLDVLYAMDHDEAALLAQQEAERLGALLLPTTLPRDRVDRLIERIGSLLQAGPRALVVVGLEPDPEWVEHVRARGVQWRIWEPYDERELRFVMSAAMATEHDGERRKDPRIPTRIETTVFMGRHRKDLVVHDLSVSGAYLATPHPFLEGSRLHVEIPLADGEVARCRAEVVNAKTADKPGRRDVPEGMGVTFVDVPPETRNALSRHVAGWLRRFRL